MRHSSISGTWNSHVLEGHNRKRNELTWQLIQKKKIGESLLVFPTFYFLCLIKEESEKKISWNKCSQATLFSSVEELIHFALYWRQLYKLQQDQFLVKAWKKPLSLLRNLCEKQWLSQQSVLVLSQGRNWSQVLLQGPTSQLPWSPPKDGISQAPLHFWWSLFFHLPHKDGNSASLSLGKGFVVVAVWRTAEMHQSNTGRDQSAVEWRKYMWVLMLPKGDSDLAVIQQLKTEPTPCTVSRQISWFTFSLVA